MREEITNYIPRRNSPLGVDHSLPGHVVVMEALCGVGRQVFQADADLARTLGCMYVVVRSSVSSLPLGWVLGLVRGRWGGWKGGRMDGRGRSLV